jgi:hypothetical protein
MSLPLRLMLPLLLTATVGCGPSVTTQGPTAKDSASHQPTPITIPATGVIHISANDLIAQFKADENAADRLFRDRTVEVTGKVVHAWKRKTGEPVVTFGEIGSYNSPKVECYFEAKDNPNVSEGQTCVIRGRCMGKGIGVGTWIKECVVLPAGE